MLERTWAFLRSAILRHVGALGRSGLVVMVSVVAACSVLVMFGRENIEPGVAFLWLIGIVGFDILYLNLPPDRE